MVVDDQLLLASADQEGGTTVRKVNVEKAPVVDALELSALEHFIDCSFQNVFKKLLPTLQGRELFRLSWESY